MGHDWPFTRLGRLKRGSVIPLEIRLLAGSILFLGPFSFCQPQNSITGPRDVPLAPGLLGVPGNFADPMVSGLFGSV